MVEHSGWRGAKKDTRTVVEHKGERWDSAVIRCAAVSNGVHESLLARYAQTRRNRDKSTYPVPGAIVSKPAPATRPYPPQHASIDTILVTLRGLRQDAAECIKCSRSPLRSSQDARYRV